MSVCVMQILAVSRCHINIRCLFTEVISQTIAFPHLPPRTFKKFNLSKVLTNLVHGIQINDWIHEAALVQ